MTHTPGPWKVQALSVEGQEIILRTHGEMTIGAPESYAVASVPLRHVSINGQLANARLIAAAPDMLEALKGILANFHESVTTAESLAEFPALQAVAQAIAQAEGRL
jgi:hypothetical protein